MHSINGIIPYMDLTAKTLRIFRKESPVKVLGPYARAVVWVQGCGFACPQCIVPESWAMDAGQLVSVSSLAGWILEQPSIEGITISGGEPMLQAESVCALIDHVKASRDLGVVCYTGYTHAFLRTKGTDSQKQLLKRLDLLIDGVYLQDRHDSLLWRGSSNQNLVPLSDRYQSYVESARVAGDRSVGVEVVVDQDGGIGYAGVPAKPGFRESFIQGMKARGIRLAYELQSQPKEQEATL